jgi:hypothetical protein
MLTTAAAVLAAIALLMPGFIIAELSVARSARGSRSDLELALRALSYTLVVHVVFGFWTVHLISDVGQPVDWTDHWGALTAYGFVVLLAVPVVIGTALNRYLAHVESGDGPPNLFAAAFGAGEARDAFDFAYQRWRKEGGYVIVELVGHTEDTPRLVGGIYGRRSAVGQTPSPHDVYLESLCTVTTDADGIRSLADRVSPEQGVYIAASQIARIDCCRRIRRLPCRHEQVGESSSAGRRAQCAQDTHRTAGAAEARTPRSCAQEQIVSKRGPIQKKSLTPKKTPSSPPAPQNKVPLRPPPSPKPKS